MARNTRCCSVPTNTAHDQPHTSRQRTTHVLCTRTSRRATVPQCARQTPGGVGAERCRRVCPPDRAPPHVETDGRSVCARRARRRRRVAVRRKELDLAPPPRAPCGRARAPQSWPAPSGAPPRPPRARCRTPGRAPHTTHTRTLFFDVGCPLRSCCRAPAGRKKKTVRDARLVERECEQLRLPLDLDLARARQRLLLLLLLLLLLALVVVVAAAVRRLRRARGAPRRAVQTAVTSRMYRFAPVAQQKKRMSIAGQAA